MIKFTCATCECRKRENAYNTHTFRDECHHPEVVFKGNVAYPEIGRGRAVTPDHSDPPVIKTHPKWCPRIKGANNV